MNQEKITKRVREYMDEAIKCQKKGEWVLACQYLLDANNLLPKERRVKMPPPPRPEDYF